MLATTTAVSIGALNGKTAATGRVYNTPLIQGVESLPVFPDITPNIQSFGNTSTIVQEGLYGPQTYQLSMNNCLLHADQLAFILPAFMGFGTTTAEGTGTYKTDWTALGDPIAMCINERYSTASAKNALFELGYFETITFGVSQANEELKWGLTWKGHLMTPEVAHPSTSTKDNTDNIMFGNQTDKVSVFSVTPEGGSAIDFTPYVTDFSCTMTQAVTLLSKCPVSTHPVIDTALPSVSPAKSISLTYNGIESNPNTPNLALQSLYLGATSTTMPSTVTTPKKCAVTLTFYGGAATDVTKKYMWQFVFNAFHSGKQEPNGNITGKFDFASLISARLIHDVAGASIIRPS